MRIEPDIKLDYKNVLIRPKRSTLTSRKEVSLVREFNYRNYNTENICPPDFEGIPIIAANMDGVGTFKMADKLAEGEIMTCLKKTYTSAELISYFDSEMWERREYVAMSIGISDSDLNKFKTVYDHVGKQLKYVCIDVANGYTERFVNFIQEFRLLYADIVIIAGNVVTADQTQELILNGADIVKVGIGPGSVCTTRIKTGVGYPQLSAVIECADAAHGLGGHIIADGGCTSSGDIAKAFAGGADFVMLGGMLAGHDEGGGEVIAKHYETNEVLYNNVPTDFHSRNETPVYKRVVETKKFVQFYGMSSKAANDKHFGGLKEYRSSEGREVLVPYRGEVAKTIQDILGGIRSTCTYVGADELKRLNKCTTFVMCHDTHNRIYEGS
jgi:GMP reductase